jgi:hypothetical protein
MNTEAQALLKQAKTLIDKAIELTIEDKELTDDGWTDHDGTDCPVPRNTLVEVVIRDWGNREPSREARDWNWRWNVEQPGNLIKYRITKEEV